MSFSSQSLITWMAPLPRRCSNISSRFVHMINGAHHKAPRNLHQPLFKGGSIFDQEGLEKESVFRDVFQELWVIFSDSSSMVKR